jgi:uncharacterized protein (DUF1697 family)
VQTYIQSGNVVCRLSATRAGTLPSVVAAAILERFGYRVPVVTRTASEVADVALGNPFLNSGREVDTLHVAFLADEPKSARVAALDVGRSPPDELAVKGREIYLCLPNGVAKSKLTNAYLDATLGTTSTLRNWRTVLKLIELAGD